MKNIKGRRIDDTELTDISGVALWGIIAVSVLFLVVTVKFLG
mgnify:CR=1 FL=1